MAANRKMSRKKADLIILNASEMLTLAGGEVPRREVAMSDLGVVSGGALAVKGSRIEAAGSSREILDSWHSKQAIDASGCVVMPGFVDPHTHPVFAGSRENEFEMRIRGKTYEEIAAAGGGILNSVARLRATPTEALYASARARLDLFLEYGTTTVEAKSGYGLSVDDEMRSLQVLKDLARSHPVEIAPTLLGAHKVPPEFAGRRKEYVSLVAGVMIPIAAKTNLAEYCDVFCERGAFTVSESRTILKAAKNAGLGIRIHADQFSASGGSKLAAELGAASADHLEAVSAAGIRMLAGSGAVAVLLPGSSFFLDQSRFAPARKLIEAGVPVALATDFNPGSSMTHSMQIILTLACLRLKMTPAEAITAATINAAAAIGRHDRIGSIEAGKKADIIILSVPNHRYIPYHFGGNHVRTVIKKGKVVIRR